MHCAFCRTTKRQMDEFAAELGVQIADVHCCDLGEYEVAPTFDIGWAA